MKRSLKIVLMIFILLIMNIPAAAMAMSAPIYIRTSSPLVMPYLLAGERIELDSFILELDSVGMDSVRAQVRQALEIKTSSNEVRRAEIAIPVYGSLKSVYETVKITLDGEPIDRTFRLAAPVWREAISELPDYDGLVSASIREELSGLSLGAPYKLKSFDVEAPLSGYCYEITCAEKGFVSLNLTYSAEETQLLIDPGDNEGPDGISGQCYSRIPGEVEISMFMEAGETRLCRALVLGNDHVGFETTHHPYDGEPDTASKTPGTSVSVSRIKGMLPYDFYGEYIHKYDYDDYEELLVYKNELADIFIDRQLQSGTGFVDCLSLSYFPYSDYQLVASVISFDLAPGETRQLKVSLIESGGFVVSEDRKRQDCYYPIFTEPLESFGKTGTIEFIVSPPDLNDIVRTIPELTKTSEGSIICQNGKLFNGNVILIYNTKYQAPGGIGIFYFFLLCIIYWPITLLIMGLIIYCIIKSTIRKHESKKVNYD